MDERINITREELNEAIGAGIKLHVNGKIDKLTIQVCSLNERFEEHCKVVEPIITQFKMSKNFWEFLDNVKGKLVIIGGVIAGFVALAVTVTKLTK